MYVLFIVNPVIICFLNLVDKRVIYSGAKIFSTKETELYERK